MADDIIKEAKEAFEQCQEAERDNRKWFLDDIKFARVGEQWDERDRKARSMPGNQRPCLTINKLQPVIRQVVNDSRLNRPSIKVHPADDDADPETAEVISGLIRNIEACSDADVAYDTAIDSAVSGGFGYWRVNLDYSMEIAEEDIGSLGSAAFEQDLAIRRIANPLSVYGDPYSTAADSSDWNVSFVVDQISKKRFKKKYPNAKLTDWDAATWQSINAPWKQEDTVQIAEYWKRSEVMKMAVGLSDGTVMLLDEYEKKKAEFDALEVTVNTNPRPIKCYKVKQTLMNGVEIIEETEWVGKYIPIIPVYGDEVNVEGKRYFRSLIRDSKDANRMYNYMRSATAEMVALSPRAPFIGKKGAFKSDAAKWASVNSASHSHIEYDGDQPPQRQPFAGVPAGLVNESMMASDDIKAITGIYDASLGARSNETSGKAITARQREGDVSTYHFIDNLSRAIRHTGRVMIDLIPKVYSTERIIRIMGEDGTPETKKINGGEPQPDEKGALVRIHDLRVGKYDLTVTSGPSFSTRREEAATQMTEFIRSYPDAAPYIMDILAKNLDWPGADEIAKRAEKMLPPQLQGENPEAQAAQAQLQEMAQAMEKMQQALERVGMDKEIEFGKLRIDERKVEVEEYKAETERMGVVPIEQLPALMAQAVAQLLSDPQELPEGEGDANPTPDEPVMAEQPY